MLSKFKRKKEIDNLNQEEDNIYQDNSIDKKKKNKKSKLVYILGAVAVLFIVVTVVSLLLLRSDDNEGEIEGSNLANLPVSISVVEADLKKNIVNDIKEIAPAYKYGVDDVKLNDVTPKEITDKHNKLIESKVTGDAKAILFDAIGFAESPESGIDFVYELLYIDFSDSWHLISAEAIDVEDWNYIPKTGISMQEILDILKELSFKNFEDGFIGSLDNTELKIDYSGNKVEDEENLSKSKSIVNIDMSVNTTFANYHTEKEVEFTFGRDGWTLSDPNAFYKDIVWDIDYMTEEEPKEHSKEYIMNLVSNPDSYFSKVINFNNVKNYTLDNPDIIPGQNGVALQYNLNVEYDNMAIITYEIIIPVEWTGASWIDGDVKIAIGSGLFSNSIGLWVDRNSDDFLMIENVKDYIDSESRDMQKIEGRVFKVDKNNELKEYKINIEPNITLSSDAFSGEIKNIKETPYSSKEVVFDLNTKEIKIDKDVFININTFKNKQLNEKDNETNQNNNQENAEAKESNEDNK